LEEIEAMGGNNNYCIGEIGGKKQGVSTFGFIYSTLNSYKKISKDCRTFGNNIIGQGCNQYK
jgi:hypothetical protein